MEQCTHGRFAEPPDRCPRPATHRAQRRYYPPAMLCAEHTARVVAKQAAGELAWVVLCPIGEDGQTREDGR